MFQNSIVYSPTVNAMLQKRVDFMCVTVKKLPCERSQSGNKIKIYDLLRIGWQTEATVLQSAPIFYSLSPT